MLAPVGRGRDVRRNGIPAPQKGSSLASRGKGEKLSRKGTSAREKGLNYVAL